MRFPIIPVIAMLLINCGIDLYIFRVLRHRLGNRIWSRIHAGLSLLLLLAMLAMIFVPKRHGDDGGFLMLMWGLYAYLSVYVPKLIFVIFDLVSRIPRLSGRKAWRYVSTSGIILAAAVFIAMWWGALINRYRINVEEVEISSASIPPAFNGFRIVQLSDLHVGTYGSDTAFMHKMVDKVNSLHPDMIVFTGDIVNRRSCELRPFVNTLSGLKAPYGVWSILGNHDYGDYYDWDSAEAKQQNMEDLYRMQHEMGWKLLRNSHAPVVCGGDTIKLIGVENLGDPPFKNYGNLQAAYPTLSDSSFKILLSHNPAHWTNDIRDNRQINIPLTLSGHTHAMQMSAGRISPAALRYETWGGIYGDDTGHILYVNIGMGEVGIPTRIGATPEITLITLHSTK
ncbi:MAG: metallophosphoesterase [Muribaculaceae bacterium]|nr:metallophosphoesterase [Muribaculaceae bacterium]